MSPIVEPLRVATMIAARGRNDMTDDFILETQGLTHAFKGSVAVNNADLRVRRGHMTCAEPAACGGQDPRCSRQPGDA